MSYSSQNDRLDPGQAEHPHMKPSVCALHQQIWLGIFTSTYDLQGKSEAKNNNFFLKLSIQKKIVLLLTKLKINTRRQEGQKKTSPTRKKSPIFRQI